ncbi:MAG: DUF1761 family protein [Acidobacteriota bacterium]|nr:DUF1761 family protein [Acidobacteriota bacterium]
MTDWLFMGDAFGRRYKRQPEIWRSSAQGFRERNAILWATVLGFCTCAVLILLCRALRLESLAATARLAIAIWLIAPLPLIVTNALFMKFDPLLAASHSAGWLCKLLIAAIAAALSRG